MSPGESLDALMGQANLGNVHPEDASEALLEALAVVREGTLRLRRSLRQNADPLTVTLQSELTGMLARWRASERQWEPPWEWGDPQEDADTRLEDQAETLEMAHRDLLRARQHLGAWEDQDRASLRARALAQQPASRARTSRIRP